jgi:hypothetical protein
MIYRQLSLYDHYTYTTYSLSPSYVMLAPFLVPFQLLNSWASAARGRHSLAESQSRNRKCLICRLRELQQMNHFITTPMKWKSHSIFHFLAV